MAVARPRCPSTGFSPPTEVAMPSYRMGQAAELLGVSVDTVRRWVDEGRITATRSQGGRRLLDGAGPAEVAVGLTHERDADVVVGRSARNRFPGIVTKVVKDKVTAHVEI